MLWDSHRTNKHKKFLKKPRNKTAKKQFFKELQQTIRQKEIAQSFVKNDLETFAKILQFADISKELDLRLMRLLIRAVQKILISEEDVRVEVFFNFARHNILLILFQILDVLKEKILTDYKNLQIDLLSTIFVCFNMCLALKRVEKLLRTTEFPIATGLTLTESGITKYTGRITHLVSV